MPTSISFSHWIQAFTEIFERSLADCRINKSEISRTTHQKECSPCVKVIKQTHDYNISNLWGRGRTLSRLTHYSVQNGKFLIKNYKAYTGTGKYGSFIGIKKKSTESIPEEAQTLAILDKDFMLTVLNMLKLLKGNHGKRTKGNQENDVRTTWKYG